ncbi:MAG: hypothetical protein NW207_06890 [Cytophagales bacterium]|nr:hypothetical protein [Cytophagales bacterium]
MKICLLRVGIDKICGGIHSPIFKDGTYEFVPIPEYYYRHHTFDENKIPTFGTLKGSKNKPFIEYFKHEGKDKDEHIHCPVHTDPEFVTYTYGDGNHTKNKLTELQKGDYIVFYAAMEGFDFDMEPAMYIFGYFEVEYSFIATQKEHYDIIFDDFKNNFHIKHQEIFARDIANAKNKGLKLVKGSPKSRMLKYAYLISKKNTLSHKKVHSISPDMQQLFGDFGGKIAIQKNPLRWIKDKELVQKTVHWLKNLE